MNAFAAHESIWRTKLEAIKTPQARAAAQICAQQARGTASTQARQQLWKQVYGRIGSPTHVIPRQLQRTSAPSSTRRKSRSSSSVPVSFSFFSLLPFFLF
eukprot:TRINITY_DN1441_c0_g1_i6.p3 TRINITY_DN1441_c0_g1~~TRINITY_DN1441_c0_g1_i6.p3  ORF type:complete len:100 (+),score=11.59 TRINITY_DN1441_c0_g1_i6:358-657(+)